MLALPGSAYLYQGEELGLPEVADLPDGSRQDPTFRRTEGTHYGRDGCRVPIPWEAGSPAAGFSPTGESWLPQPASWPTYARDAQRGVADSTLEFYRQALALRTEHGLGAGEVTWLDHDDSEVLTYRNGAVTVVANTGAGATTLPAGRVVLASGSLGEGILPADTTVWLEAD